MTVLLVRHAVAVSRKKWDGPDHLRPLSNRGHRQADALVQQLEAFPVARVLSSAAVRCVDTVRPLADDRGVKVEEVDELLEGAGGVAANLIRDAAVRHDDVVLCTHGDVLPELLARLCGDLELPSPLPCAKGSTWVLDHGHGRFISAHYLHPPA